jgi:purine-nucleoside phosphorylase
VTGVREELERGVADVRAAIGDLQPRVGLILGSGLGAFADTLADRVELPFERITGLPRATIVGHAGVVAFGHAGPLPVAAFKGRIHYYEGHDLARVAYPARLLVALGCKTLILTNAAGGIDPTLAPGEIVILRDHLNLLGGSPLRGPNDDALGPRFPDMSEVYARSLRQIAASAGAAAGLKLREGVYAACPGPNYETPSEVRMLRALGADLVGMSTVPEAIAARHMGARVLGLSCVTNLAAGITDQPLSHEEVTETAARVRGTFQALLSAILARLAEQRP